jgi:hypothetical protein
VSNAWLRAGGGFIFADAPNAVTSAAAIVHQISMHRNTMPPRGTRLSPASSPASIGFTTTVLKNPSPARSFPLLTRIRWINRCPDQPEPSLRTGKRCSTNRGQLLGAAALAISLCFSRAREARGHHELASKASRRCRAERHARGESPADHGLDIEAGGGVVVVARELRGQPDDTPPSKRHRR